MAIDIVDFPIKNGGSFHSYVKTSSPKMLLLKSTPAAAASNFPRASSLQCRSALMALGIASIPGAIQGARAFTWHGIVQMLCTWMCIHVCLYVCMHIYT